MLNTELIPPDTERLRLMAEVRKETEALQKSLAHLESQKAGIERAIAKNKDAIAKNLLLLANNAPGYLPAPVKPPVPAANGEGKRFW